jgi:phosphoglycolate phosphatase
MRSQLVIFDFDGVLADSAAWFLEILGPLARAHRFRELTRDEIEALRGRPNREIVRQLGVPPWRLPAIARHVRALSAEAAERIPLFPGVPPLLAGLGQAGVRIAVVSSNAETTIRTVLGADLAGLVHDFECGASLFGKARLIRRVLHRSGVAPSRALAVGDETRDVEAARRAGAPAAAALWGYARPEAFDSFQPDHAFDTPDALRRFLLGPG